MHVLGTYRPFDTLPHAFFDAMTLMVAASLLLAIAAAARTIWLRARPTGAAKPGVGQSPVSSSWGCGRTFGRPFSHSSESSRWW